MPRDVGAAVAFGKPSALVVEAKFIGGNLGYQSGNLVDGVVTRYGLCFPKLSYAGTATRAEIAALH